MADKDYYSFDEVLSDLRMQEDELKRLVSAGEIRAFRDQDTMRFKASDVERLKDVPDGAGDELELDLGDDLNLGDDLDLDVGDDLVIDDDGPTIAPVVEELDLAAEARSSRGTTKRGGTPERRSPRSQALGANAEETEGAGVLFTLVLGFVLLVLANFAALGSSSGQTNALTGFLADMFKN